MSTLSLRKRLLIAATFTLIAFLGLAGVALDRAFISSAEVTTEHQLKTQINTLLTILEINPDGSLIIPEGMPETRLSSPNSGLYAFILDNSGELLWRSESTIGITPDFLQVASPGQENFYQLGSKFSSPFYYSFGINWEITPEQEVALTLIIIDEGSIFSRTVKSHRKVLVFWLGMAGILLLVMQGLSLRWGLKPLGQVMMELDQIGHAKQGQILGVYPQEIAQLSKRINLFIDSERKNLARYRNTLGDLAHSFKTPLAVIKGITESDGELDKKNLNEQVDRMNKIVEYQLKRVSASQLSVIQGAMDAQNVIKKLDASLQKVYADKNISASWNIMSDSIFYGDESDLYELLGNVMDNAFKWAKSKVEYTTRVSSDVANLRNGLTIEIHDDGPGIANAQRVSVLQRGARADQQISGQGIGLAVVREIVERYDGALTIESSYLGGALIRVSFPSTW